MQEKIEVQYSEVIDLALDTIRKQKQALIFVNTKASAEKQAEEIAKKLKIKDEELTALSQAILNVLSSPTKQCKRLSECMKKGTAFHHAGLNQKQREIVEDGFRAGKVKVICATPTLAAGVDLPAYRTILKDLKRYGMRGLQFIPVLEYQQMAGRAGRPKYDNEGQAICIATTESQKKELVERYIHGEPEVIYSKLAAEPVLRTYILSLIASGLVKTKQDMMNFFEKTFFAHQFKDMKKIELLLMKVLGMLKDWQLIKGKEEDFVSANDLDEKYYTTLLGKRVAELYLDPLTASKLVEGLKKEKERVTFSYLHLVSHTLEMRPLLRVRAKEYEDVQSKIAENEFNLLDEDYFDDYDGYNNSIKTAWFFEEWISEKNEEFLLEKFSIRPGEIKYKVDIADWLLFSCQEMSKILLFKDQLKDIIKIRQRLKYGVKEELLPLVRLKGIGKSRARIMYNNGVKDIKGLNNIDITSLKQLIGEKTALKIKKQLSQG